MRLRQVGSASLLGLIAIAGIARAADPLTSGANQDANFPRAQISSFELAQAQQEGGQPPGGPGEGQRGRHGPPPEAVAACNGKASGEPCSFVDRHNETRTGTCFAPPPGASSNSGAPAPSRPLACRPAHPRADKPEN